MKKILLTFLAIFLFSQISLAQEANIENTVIQMPTDEEIMEIIEKYGLEENQKESVFKDTKKKLQEIYEQNQKIKEE